MELILAEIGLGNCADIRVGGQHGSGHSGDQPVRVVEAGFGKRFSRILYEVFPLNAPRPAGEKLPVIWSNRGSGFGFGRESAMAKNFDFAEDVAVRRGGARHENANVASLCGLRQFKNIDGA